MTPEQQKVLAQLEEACREVLDLTDPLQATLLIADSMRRVLGDDYVIEATGDHYLIRKKRK